MINTRSAPATNAVLSAGLGHNRDADVLCAVQPIEFLVLKKRQEREAMRCDGHQARASLLRPAQATVRSCVLTNAVYIHLCTSPCQVAVA